jgi:hypothetical protein
LADLQADGAPGAAGWVNRVLLAVARLEASYALRASVPFGVSAVVLARKPFGNEGG